MLSLATRYFLALASIWVAFLFPGYSKSQDLSAKERFEQQVLPILQARCFACHSHSAGSMEGGLALDWKSGWEVGGDSGPAIVPGDLQESLLIQAVRREGLEMPPDKPLTDDELSVLEDWVRLGAFDPRTIQPATETIDSNWWSLRPLAKPSVPDSDYGSNPIDAFIDSSLSERNIQRSKPADRRTLIRRLSVDLHGILPEPRDVERFVQDTSPTAYEDLVERLLSSPKYGERWARFWMDAIHFADTHGFEHDVFRDSAWPFRNYLIQAFNSDISWDEFIRQQIAVDHFAPRRSDLIPALGFLGAGPLDLSAASTAPVTFDYIDRDDMVTQTMGAFASTTANCARCHAHKFDPISQEDYYALQAVFAGAGKGDRFYDPNPDVHQQREHWQAILTAVEQANADLLLSESNQHLINQWEKERAKQDVQWDLLNPDIFVSAGGADLTRLDDGSVLASGIRPDVDTYTISGTPSTKIVSAIQLEVLPHETLPMQGPGRQDNGNLHLHEARFQLFVPDSDQAQTLSIKGATADFNQAGWAISQLFDSDPKTAWGIYPEVGKAHRAVFELVQPVDIPEGSKIVIELKQLLGAGHLIGRLKISTTSAPAESAAILPTNALDALNIPKSERNSEHKLAIASFVLPRIATKEIKKLPPQQKVYSFTRSFDRGVATTNPVTPKVVHVLSRGNIDRPGEIALPGALTAVDALDARFNLQDGADESLRRAALASWLADVRNPLTWRSITNRVWQHLLGTGICDTPSDFGRMGGTPSHPELLDWLSCELREHDGSLKHLHRLIVTSQTYQQSSTHNPPAAEIDGENRLLWRANRKRMDAETYHDCVLQIAGMLEHGVVGPGEQYFQLTPGQQATPKVHYGRFDWTQDAVRRRAIYRVVWRGIPDPFFEVLDFPDLGLLAPKRSLSTSALQSLALWNHPFVLAHCQKVATHISSRSSDPQVQITLLFKSALQREPAIEEFAMLRNYTDKHGLPATVRLILNSNEFLFID